MAANSCEILAERECAPCAGRGEVLDANERDALHAQLGGGWAVVKGHHLEKEFAFSDFAAALAFTNRVGRISERQGHHPDICLGWGRAKVQIWTQEVDGLTEADFVLAAKIENTYNEVAAGDAR